LKTILQINSSLSGEQGASSKLASRFVASLLEREPGSRRILRDLATDPLPHLSAERFQAFTTPAAERSESQRREVAESDALIAELREADVIVFGLPMYNFGIPSTLKAYFDHVARAGETFRYTPQGPVGLLGGRKAYILATRGGRYAGTPMDSQTAYVKQFLGFIGIDDVEFVYAEGLALGDEQREAALAGAGDEITRLAA
jgi:FMN-dependent NADH-azoreductase